MRSRSLYVPLGPVRETIGNLSRHMHMVIGMAVASVPTFSIAAVSASLRRSIASCAVSCVGMKICASHNHVHEEERGEGRGSMATAVRGGIGDISRTIFPITLTPDMYLVLRFARFE